MKKFHLAHILTVTTGILFPAPGVDYPITTAYEILNYMTGDDLYTHALPRAAIECRPYLLEQFPFTKEINLDTMLGTFQEKFERLVQQYGEWHMVRPIHPEDHEVIDPIDELKRIRPDLTDENIIVLHDDDSPNSSGEINWKV